MAKLTLGELVCLKNRAYTAVRILYDGVRLNHTATRAAGCAMLNDVIDELRRAEVLYHDCAADGEGEEDATVADGDVAEPSPEGGTAREG